MSFGPISLLVPRFKSFDPPQADRRFTTHKEDLIRREVQQRWKARPRRDLEPKSYFEMGSKNAGLVAAGYRIINSGNA